MIEVMVWGHSEHTAGGVGEVVMATIRVAKRGEVGAIVESWRTYPGVVRVTEECPKDGVRTLWLRQGYADPFL